MYTIQSIEGSIVASGTNTNNPISIESLPNGVYFLKFETSEFSQAIKFIKQ